MTKIEKKIVAQAIVTAQPTQEPTAKGFPSRPDTLSGTTTVMKPPGQQKIFVTLNHQDGRLREVFIDDKGVDPWKAAVALLLSEALKQGLPADVLANALRHVGGDGYFAGQRYVESPVAHLAILIGQSVGQPIQAPTAPDAKQVGALCPECGEYTMVTMDGCLTCTGCGHSKCG